MSTPINDGGNAFPEVSCWQTPIGTIAINTRPGMSLRDYATIEFMKSLIGTLPQAGDRKSPYIIERTVRAAQNFADAFLAARKEQA